MADDSFAAPTLTWPNIISTALVVLALAGGSWTLLQSQRNSDRELMLSKINALDARDEDSRADRNRIAAELEKHFDALEKRIVRETDVLHVQFVRRERMDEAMRRIDEHLETLRKQLAILEQTRPTTGELGQSIIAINARFQQIEERMRQLEQRDNRK